MFQYAVTAGSSGTYYIYLKDNIGYNLGNDAAYITNVSSYSGYTGFLLGGISYSHDVPIYKIGYTIEINRTKIGLNASMCGLTSTKRTLNFSGYSDYTKGVNDVTTENIYRFMFGAGDSPSTLSFGNGTIITLEEFA